MFLTMVHNKFKPDIWYVNTIIQPDVLRQAKKMNFPCVVHTHELEQMLVKHTGDELQTLVRYPQLVIACSQTARDVFQVMGRTENIEVCYGTIVPSNIKWSEERSREIRKNLNISDDTFVWAMAGSLDPNKNPVRFVEIASEMLTNNLDVHFMWLGRAVGAYGHYAREKAQALGVAAKVSFLEEKTDDYYDHLNAADGLLLTSYKESFSIAAVEAAYLGKPVAAFNCGGVKEIIREGMGTVIDSWNSSDLIRAMVSIMNGETRFDPHVARERVKEFHIEVQGARWEEIMHRYFPPQPPA